MNPSNLRLYHHCPDIPDNLRSSIVFGFGVGGGGGGGSGWVARRPSGGTTHQQGDSVSISIQRDAFILNH